MTPFVCKSNSFLYNGQEYLHNSLIVEWPNQRLARLLEALPLSASPWRKRFGDANHTGLVLHLDASGRPWQMLGLKSDRYWARDNWIALVGRHQSLVSMYFVNTTPAKMFETLEALSKQWNPS